MKKNLSLIIIGFLTFQFANKALGADQAFALSGKALIVNSTTTEMRIEGAAVNYLRDKQSNEVVLDSSAWTNRPGFSDGYTPSEGTTPTLSVISGSQAVLKYPVKNNSNLSFNIAIESDGDIVVKQVVEGTSLPARLDFPIMNLTLPAVITGGGARYVRQDPEVNIGVSTGMDSPIVTVLEGTNTAVGIWSETTSYPPQNIELAHKLSHDLIFLYTGSDSTNTTSNKIESSPWHFQTYPNWVEAARDWRTRFEARSGAQPLWNNRAPWVRNVHAMFWGTNNYGSLSDLVNLLKSSQMNIDPSKVISFLWNGDRLVRFGDHTLAKTIGFPESKGIALMNQNKMPMVLYHPWVLYETEVYGPARIEKMRTDGWLPTDYTFKPDYGGTPENWFNYWANNNANYYDGKELYQLHPGSNKFQEYLKRNLSAYLDLYKSQGAYLDILGTDHTSMFIKDRQVQDGRTYAQGEKTSIENFVEARPDLAIMSEYLPERLLNRVFWTWQGSETHQAYYSKEKINHPLKSALMSSYAWTRESNSSNTDLVTSTLLGTLPEISLKGNFGITSDAQVAWSQERVKLFCNEELFYDLPPVWDKDALAYFRSKLGYWFKFKKVGNEYAYIQEIPGSSDLIRLKVGGTLQSGPTTPVSNTSNNPVVGDATGEGDVNLFDYSVIVNNYNKSTTNGFVDGDFNLDQKVDGQDYILWLNNYKQ